MFTAICAASGGFSLDTSRWQQPSRLVIVVLAFVAVLNLIAGVVIASWPERQSDLETIQRWCGLWLYHGVDVYSAEGELPDYPPHALVLLSPLSAVTLHSGVLIWACVNLLLLPMTAFLAIKHVSPRVSLAAAAIAVLLFLCWGGSRTLLQFSLVSLAFGLLASVLSDRRPVLSGICLAVALMKPQIASPFFIWLLMVHRWKVVAIGLSGVLFGVAVYCAHAGANPLEVGVRYVDNLRLFYTRDALLVGIAQLRPLFELSLVAPHLVDLGVMISSAVLLGIIAVARYYERGTESRLMFAAPGLVALWSLLTFHHLTNGFLLLWPLAALLLFSRDPETATFRWRLFWLLQIGLVFDVPGLWRRFGHLLRAPTWIDDVLMHFDRAFMLAVFAAVAVLATRSRR